jgi:anaerobic selenocysteine-containing dehydrogenase
MRREHRSVCRACPAQCGVVVTVEGDRVAAVRGDPAHPRSQGYTCPKGRGLAAFHHSPRRLDGPALHGREAPWEDVVDDLALHLRRIIDEHGPAAVALYSSMGMGFDSAGLLAELRLFGALGSSRYSALMLDCGPLLRAAQMVAGSGWEMNPVWVPEDVPPSVAVLVGCNPVVSHGYQTNLPNPVARMRGYQRRGGQIWVIDPRRTESAELAGNHLAPRPGTDGAVLAWLARELLHDGADRTELERYCRPDDVERLRAGLEPFDLPVVVARTGVSEASLLRLLEAVRAAGRIAIVTGTGVQFAPDGLVIEWLRWVVAIVTGSVDHEGGMWVPPGWISPFEQRATWEHAPEDGSDAPGPPSRADLRQLLGEYPAVALVDEIEAGNVKALVVSGGSPLTAAPEPDRLRAALDRLEVLAVTDVVRTELTDRATHRFAVTAMLERSDVARNKGHTSFAPAVVPIGADRRPAWWLWGEVGRRLGVDPLGGVAVEGCSDEVLNRQLLAASREGADALFAAGPHGIATPRLWGWVHERALPGGRWRIAPAPLLERLPRLLTGGPEDGRLTLVARRARRRTNATHYGSESDLAKEPPYVLLHPDDAAAVGVADGEPVRVSSDAGGSQALARLDPRMLPGTVSLTHGWAAPNAANLISSEADPLTGQPFFTAVPVSVEPVAARLPA